MGLGLALGLGVALLEHLRGERLRAELDLLLFAVGHLVRFRVRITARGRGRGGIRARARARARGRARGRVGVRGSRGVHRDGAQLLLEGTQPFP